MGWIVLGNGIPFRRGGGKQGQTYWLTLISAVIEDGSLKDVVLTFPSGKPSLGASNFTVTVDAVDNPVASTSWLSGVLTITLTNEVEPDAVVVLTFVNTGDTANVTNSLTWAYYWSEQQELNTTANAVSVVNEANAVLGWIEYGLNGTGDNVFESQGAEKHGGNYAFHCNANDTPTSAARIYMDLSAAPYELANGDECKISFYCKHSGTGFTWIARLCSDFQLTLNITELKVIGITNTTWELVEIEFTYSANTRYFGIREVNASNNGEIYIDEVSIKKKNSVSRNINITDFGASPLNADNYTQIQAAVDAVGVDILSFGSEGETYVISKPIELASNKTYVIDSTIKIKDATETLLTEDSAASANAFTVASVVGFAVGEYVGVTDDAMYQGYAQSRGTVGKITDITGLVITIENEAENAYTTAQNAWLGHVQNCFIANNKTDILITGNGIVNNNRDGQAQIHPTHSIPLTEYQLAGCGITIYDCENVIIEKVHFINGNMHNIAITGGTGAPHNINVTVRDLTSENAHEKNILVRLLTTGVFENLVVKDGTWEDGIIFYTGCIDITASSITATGNGRCGFFWNGESSTGLVASNITTSGNGWGLYIQAKNAIISNVSCDDATLIAQGYTVSNLVINNITYTGVASVKGYVIRISGGVNGVTFNDAIITGCSVVAIKTDSLVLGDDPVDVNFVGGGIYNHTGTKLEIESGTDIEYSDFEGLD